MSLLLFFRARIAFARDTLACDMTSSMSLTSTPVSSTYHQKRELVRRCTPVCLSLASVTTARYLLFFALLLYCWRLCVFLDAWYSFSLDLELLCRSQLSLLGKIFDLEGEKPNINDEMSFRMVFPSRAAQVGVPPPKYLSFTKDDVCVWRGTLVDVWFGNDEQDVLWLANRDSRDPRYLPETQLWHCLEERKEFKSFARHIGPLIRGGEVENDSLFLPSFHSGSVWLCWRALHQSQQLLPAVTNTSLTFNCRH